MEGSGLKPIRPWLLWFVGAIVFVGFALSMDRFAIESVNPIAIFGIGMFLVGFSSIDDFREYGLSGAKLYVFSVLLGSLFVGLMIAIVMIVNLLV